MCFIRLFDDTNTAISIHQASSLSSQNAGAAGGLDLLLRNAADELGLHHDRSVNATSAQELEHSVSLQIDHRSLGGVLHGLLLSLFREQMPQLVHVDGGAVLGVTLQVEVSHTDLSEVSRVARRVNHEIDKHLQLIEKDTQMVKTSGLTTSRRMATMLS